MKALAHQVHVHTRSPATVSLAESGFWGSRLNLVGFTRLTSTASALLCVVVSVVGVFLSFWQLKGTKRVTR